jgi:hypothetical protein
VIGLGEDVSDPAQREVPLGQALMQMMLPQVAVKDLGDLQASHHPQQQRDVVDPFLFHNNRLRLHPFVLVFPPFLV